MCSVLSWQMVKNKHELIEIISSAALSKEHHVVVLGAGDSSILGPQIRYYGDKNHRGQKKAILLIWKLVYLPSNLTPMKN